MEVGLNESLSARRWVCILLLCAMLGNDDFIWKFGVGSNLLFGKLKIFKFEFGSNPTIVFKVVKVKNLRMTTQIPHL